MQGVSKDTSSVLEIIKHYKELDQYYLVGGTGLAIQINHRLSEDIDLFYYNQFPGRKIKLPKINGIYNKLKKDFQSIKIERWTDTGIQLVIDGVKMDIYSEHRLHRAKEFSRLGNIRLPSVKSLIGMKLISLGFRESWRDMYDLFCLGKMHGDIDFYQGYKMIVSSAFLGSKSKDKKVNTYNGLVAKKLRNIDYINSVKDDSKLEGLNPAFSPSADEVVKTFKNFGNITLAKN